MIWLLKICFHTKAQVWFMKMECNMQAFHVHSSLLQKTPYGHSCFYLLLKSFSWPWMISWTAAGSSRVLRSPKPSKSLSTTLRSTRRIILPERVFGRRLANCDEHQHNEKLLHKVSHDCQHVQVSTTKLPGWNLEKRTWRSFQIPCRLAALTSLPLVHRCLF